MTVTIKRIALRALSADEAEAHRALGRNIAPFALAVGKARMLAGLGGPVDAAATDPWLRLTLDGAEAAVQVPLPLIARLVDLSVEGGQGEDIALLLEDALADWLDAAEAAGLPTVRLATVAPGDPALAVRCSLGLRGQTEGGQFLQYRAPLCLSEAAARRLAARLASKVEPRQLHADLPVIAQIRLAGPLISPGALARLRPGDGIRLPLAAGAHAPFTLHLGDTSAPVTPENGGYRLASALRPHPKEDSAMDRPAETSQGDTRPGPDTDALPIRLSFRVGDAAISLGELGTLGPGALIPVPGGPDATVEILANGRRIGTGELVSLGEARAVRVIGLE